jgi:protein-disulfide isomerase
MRDIWFAVLIGLTLAGAAPAVAAPPSAAGKADVAGVLAVTPGDRILGNPQAPITIIEYASLSCPHCAHFETEVLPQVQKKWIDTGKAKLVMRDFPLDRAALRAEMLARCVPPERYYPLVKTLFATQEEWVLAKDQAAALERIAKLAGIGQKQADACLASKKLENEVAQSRLTASQQLGVDATPTFFVNGKKFEGAPTAAAFDQLLSGAAAKGKS